MALFDVIKYDGGPEIFAWKHPKEDLGTWSQLIVNESQEAVLFKGGKALDLFTSGRHTLETANIPLLNKLVNLPFGKRSPFTAEVWYVNKVNSLDIKWGTATPIQLQDPKYNVFLPVRSFGQFGIQIQDAKKFLVKLVGTLRSFDKKNIISYFRGLYLTKVKDAISTYLVHKKISVLEINAYLEELSEELQEKMIPVLDEYGIRLVNFYVNNINVPEDEPTVIKLKEALSKKAEMDIIGYNYTQERSFDTMEGAATNQSTGHAGFMGAGMGLGMGVGMGGVFGQQMHDMSSQIRIEETKECPKCHIEVDKNMRFCGSCGYDFVQTKRTVEKVENNQQPIEDDTITCSDCGEVYKNKVKFCPHCGNQYKPCPNCKADIKDGATECHVCHSKLPRPCPDCGHMIVNDRSKFCPECGYSLIKKCPECSAEVKGNPKFCSECGTKL